MRVQWCCGGLGAGTDGLPDGGCHWAVPGRLLEMESALPDHIFLYPRRRYKHRPPLFFFFPSLFPLPSSLFLCFLGRDALFYRSLTPLTRSLNNSHYRNGSRPLHPSSRSCCRFCRLRSCYSTTTQKCSLRLGNKHSSGLFTSCMS
jgi:hypothetical protein